MTLAARLARLEVAIVARHTRRQAGPAWPLTIDGVVIADEAGFVAYLEHDRATAGAEYRMTLPGEPA